MKIVIFAGGAGTRLWPLSRKNSPKQFDKLINGHSTLQMAVDRVRDAYGLYNIYVQTLENYVSAVKDQLPELPTSNIFAEPEKRDVAPAIGYAFMKLKKQGIKEPIAILWSDHLMENVGAFQKALKTGEKLILEDPNRFVYIGEKPRYAENNLGWINVDKQIEERNKIPVMQFQGWKYRPPLDECQKMFKSGKWYWNPGYWITSIDFVLSLYRKFMPKMYKQLEKMAVAFDTDKESSVISKIYPTLESIHFDKAILEKTKTSDAIVLGIDMGWSDPGTLYALKEALQETNAANVTKGKTLAMECEDCLVYNQEKNKLVTVIGLKGHIIVNTKDASIVVHKKDAIRVKDLVIKMKEQKMDEFL